MKKELYRFVEGSDIYTVTSSDSEETYNSELYSPATIGRNEIENKDQLSRANLEISFDIDNPMARRWMRQVVDTAVSLTLFIKQPSGVVFTSWKGRLSSVKPEVAAITLIFESVFTSLRRPGIRGRFQRSCRHVHYGRGCGLNKDDFAETVGVSAISGLIVTSPQAAAFPDGYFTGGMIEAPDGALRFIVNHVGANLTLIRPLENLQTAFANSGYGMNYGNAYGGIACRVFPGCPRDKETCENVYDNILRNGSFPYIPIRNPMNGSSIV